MDTQTNEQLLRAIEALSIPDRLRLLERVLHDLASHPEAMTTAPSELQPSFLGWLSDEPELADAILQHSRDIREHETMRPWTYEDTP